MRMTKQKDLILKIINNSNSHPTAHDIYNECVKLIPNISLGTVYRNLNILVDKNMIQRLKMPDHIDRYDKLIEHIHFICLKCNKVIDMEQHFKYNKNIDGNKILNCKISFEGICEYCQTKGEC